MRVWTISRLKQSKTNAFSEKSSKIEQGGAFKTVHNLPKTQLNIVEQAYLRVISF